MTAAIVGVGETDYMVGDPRPTPALVMEAIHRALDEAGIAAAEVDGFATEAYFMVHDAPVDEIASRLRVRDRNFSGSVSQAGAGVVAAAQLGRMAIDSGLASIVVSYYGLNLSQMPGGPYGVHAAEPMKAAFEMPFGFYGQPLYFGAIAQRYRHEYGLTESQLGSVAVSARAHAVNTPGALRREPLTLDDYRSSRMVADPLRTLDCCLVNDGAIAFVMTSLERARDLKTKPVIVAGSGFGAKPLAHISYFTQSENLLDTAATISAPKAFKQAGLSPHDVDLAEIYDCFTIATILGIEDLGFVAKGEGAAFAESGAIGPGGVLPVNTHGGLLSHSYLVGGNHVIEAVRQLRGERGIAQVPDAEVAAVAGHGSSEHATLILTADR